jgi:hypothetical protein
VEYWDLPEYPDIQEADTDVFYDVDSADRIDKLAERFYGARDLWWIIALANNLRLLPNDMFLKQRLRIPSSKRVFTEILRRPLRGREGR